MVRILLLLVITLHPSASQMLKEMSWGFFAHRQINRHAVFTLPPDMIGFYKQNIVYITENAVRPDVRRYSDEAEAPRHYIDLDVYGDEPFTVLPMRWDSAVTVFGEDTLNEYGIAPWHIYKLKNFLTSAFLEQDAMAILQISADIGHYIADIHVPLHTTQNYNGQLTGQEGVHGFWESRLPELFFERYSLFTGKAAYHRDPLQSIWNTVRRSFLATDSVLRFEKELSEDFEPSGKYAYEDRGGRTVKTYSYEYSKRYHELLDGMVERQLRSAIKMTGDIWYTCWVDAGQPDLGQLQNPQIDTLRTDLDGDPIGRDDPHHP